MSSTAKVIVSLVRPVLPYLPLLPTPLLSLTPTLLLHVTSHPSPSILSFVTSSNTHPLHPPIIFTFVAIPLIYILGLISGNVSWVDRAWPFFTPICSGMLVAWMWLNPEGDVYGHNLPRVLLMWVLQLLWSTRLLSHALKRDFYNLRSEDYRYTVVRQLVPRPVFALIHIFVVALAQPLLLLALCLPVHAAMSLPPSELASTGGFDITFGKAKLFLPARYAASAPDATPVLNLADLIVSLAALTCLYVEYKSDRAMYDYQSSKHALLDKPQPSTKLVKPQSTASQSASSSSRKLPQPATYPASHHPGFPVKGRWTWSRHPNFAAEQLFWLTQALIVVAGARSSGVTRRGWGAGSVFGPAFALSILFCSSTLLTEWITSRKFPAYKSYKKLVGQFLPQETAWLWLWSTITRTRGRAVQEVYGVSDSQVASGSAQAS
ncbi:hypothetical protein IAU60_004858 [Kwoniella sp. DSM 27419]